MTAGSVQVAGTRRDIVMREWEVRELSGVALSDGDRALVAALGKDRRVVIDELRTGLRVRTRAWVGVLRLEALTLRVLPKLAGDALGVARMLAFVRGTDRLQRRVGEQPIEASRTDDLLELLALLLADACERVVRGGLYAGYREHEDELAAVRGRLLVDRQVLERFGRVERVLCRFDELELDTDENRLLALALQACARRVRGDRLHRRLRYLEGLFSEICAPERLDLDTARTTLTYDRQNAHYHEAHELAWLILDGFGVRDLLAAAAPTQSFAFLLDMNSLFEEFVWRLFERLFPPPDQRVEPQARNRSVLWDVGANQSYRSIRPDLVLHRRVEPRAAVAIDAKYKRYDAADVASADIYQGLLYAQAYGRGEDGPVPTAMLVYPSEGDDLRRETIQLRRPDRQRAAVLVVIGLPVRLTLERIGATVGSPALTLRDIVARVLSAPGDGA
jgi:5-methylcytosine-specific restriction enzyme subunit McrC